MTSSRHHGTALARWTGSKVVQHGFVKHLMRAASRDEDAFFAVLLKVPGLNAVLNLELLQMVAAQVESLQQNQVIKHR